MKSSIQFPCPNFLIARNDNSRFGKKSNGSALLTALLITALVAILGTVIAFKQGILIRMTQLVFQSDQIYSDSLGIEQWAISQLSANAQQGRKEQFPIIMPELSFQNAHIQGQIDDQLGLFNLNALNSTANQAAFLRLLRNILPNLPLVEAQNLTQAINDWIEPSNADEYYLKLSPPYRAPHQFMASITELRLIRGVTSSIYETLAPYVTALPNNQNRININTAPLPILLSLSDQMTAEIAQQLIHCRNSNQGFNTIEQFQTNCLSKLNIQLDRNINLLTSSNYFLVTSAVKIDNQQSIAYSLIHRELEADETSKSIKIEVINRSFNTR